jgi:uncharacterized protein (TIGR03435 family)
LAQLISSIEGGAGRRIVDGTGLSGSFEWQLDFNPIRDAAVSKSSEVPSVFLALEDQLGLRLQASTAAMEVYVIDSVEMPSPN